MTTYINTIDQVMKTSTSKRFVIGQRPIACPRSNKKIVVNKKPAQIAKNVMRGVINLFVASE
jgi:hypothetical protein